MVTNPVGVPQGSILGPLFFSLFINDLPDVCPSTVNFQMYTDDTVIYSTYMLKTKSKLQKNDQLQWSISLIC